MSLFEGDFRFQMEHLPPEIAILSQAEIEKMRKMNELDYNLRENLWKLVENAHKSGITELVTKRVYEGFCSKQNFDLYIVRNPLRLAWLMHRPVEDRKKMKTLLQMLIQKVESEVLCQPITDSNVGHYIKLLEFLTNRVHGPMIQRIDARHAHVNMNKPIAEQPGNVNERLEELKKNLLQPKDVTPKNVE